jgi:hypothetical protein
MVHFKDFEESDYEGVSKSFRSESITKNKNNNKNHSLRTQRVMATKLTRLTHKIWITAASSGRELYHLQFSLQAANRDTFGYTSDVRAVIAQSV